MPSRSPLIKVFLLFMVGIILPTGFLVYLGIISIRSETLLLKKESQERVGKTAEAIHDQAQAVIAQGLAPLIQLARTVSGDSLPGAYSKLRDFHQSNPSWISMLLLLDSNNHLLYPIREARSVPAPTLPPLPLEKRQRLQQAEQSEFKDHDYAAALKIYKSLENELNSARWKAILLTSGAGCLMKLNQYDAAEARYHEILTRYGQEQDPQGYPLGLVIASQLGELQLAKGRPDLALTSFLRVLQDLMSGRWDLSWDELQFFIRHLMERLNALEQHMSAPERSRWRVLQTQWEDLKRSASESQAFLASRWPSLQQTLRDHNRSGSPYLILAASQTRRAIAYAPAYEPRTGNLQYTLLADIDAGPLIQKVRQTIGPLAVASNLAYQLETTPGILMAQSEQLPEGKRWTIRQDLAQVYPSIRLAMAPISDIPVEHASARRRQVYVGMVVLAAGVILMALFATWYAISREMEVAQLKARFVASISHELKTPLSIIGFIGQKLQMGRYESQEEIQDYYGMISEETARLKSLIDDVLDFSRLMENRQPYRKEPADLVALVKETAERFRHTLKAGGVRFECRCEPASCAVTLDKEAISRVVLNLLDNAVKYSPPDRIHVVLTLKQVDHAVLIQVSDEGYGIPPDEKGLVFDRFYRGHSATDHQPTNGAGLGLAIVKHIVEAHEGTVELQSTVGKGSIFSVQIPVRPSDA